MARDPGEIIACEDCGCVQERATALLAQARQQIDELERDLRAKRSKITALERDRTAKLRQSPRYEEALDILRHWQKVCAPNAKEIDSDDRLMAVLARLNGGHSAEELKLAATGYSKRPYVTREGRSATGTPAERKVDAALIFGTPKHVANGIAYAASPAPSGSTLSSSSVERLNWRQVQYANRRLIIRALTEQFGKPVEDQGMLTEGYLLSPCPRCDNDPALTLEIAPPGMTWLARCSSCGLDEARLIAAVTEDK